MKRLSLDELKNSTQSIDAELMQRINGGLADPVPDCHLDGRTYDWKMHQTGNCGPDCKF